MNTAPEQIDRWRAVPSEYQRLEFKAAKTQLDSESIYEYSVALANEGGGYLLLGIEDKPIPRPVVGTAAFNNPAGMEEKIFKAIGFRVEIEEVAHPGGRVLVFHIPSRPRGTAYHLEGRYLMRSGASLVPMSEDHLRRIFAEGGPDWLEEHCKQALSAQDVVELLDTQTFFELLDMPYPSNRKGVVERLVREKLVDQTAEGYSIRRIGALLLAKRLEDFSFEIQGKAPRVVVYSGTSKISTKLDQIGSMGYAVGFQRLVHFVMGQLPQSEVIENALRRKIKLVPEVAIRELVANALIHQDFTLTGMRVMIEIYTDRVEISSPGDPLVPLERFIDGYHSRNRRLTNIMRRFSICEEQSSGIDKVIGAVEKSDLPAPDFRAAYRRTNAVLYGPKPFDEMDRNARMRACYQHCVLQYIDGQQMTNQSLRTRFGLPECKNTIVSQVIRYALETGIIKPIGESRRYARYLPFWA